MQPDGVSRDGRVVFECTGGADQTVAGPDTCAPFYFFGEFGCGRGSQFAQPGEHLAVPRAWG